MAWIVITKPLCPTVARFPNNRVVELLESSSESGNCIAHTDIDDLLYPRESFSGEVVITDGERIYSRKLQAFQPISAIPMSPARKELGIHVKFNRLKPLLGAR